MASSTTNAGASTSSLAAGRYANGGGDAKSTKTNKTRVHNLVGEIVQWMHTQEPGTVAWQIADPEQWADESVGVDPATLISRHFFECALHYIETVHTISTGGHYQYAVGANHWRTIIHVVKDALSARHGGLSAAAKDFFTCLDKLSSSKSGVWLRSRLKKYKRARMISARNHAEKIDFSCLPLYREHRVNMSQTLTAEGTPEAAKRDFVLKISAQNAGRASEAAWAELSNGHVDVFFRQLVTNLVTAKTSKAKKLLIVAGKSRDDCEILSMGTVFMRSPEVFQEDPEGTVWMVRSIVGETKSPGARIGQYIKDLQVSFLICISKIYN